MDTITTDAVTIPINADTTGFDTQLKAVELSGKQFSTAMTAALDGLVLKGKSLSQVFDTLALSLSKTVLNAAFKPLTDGLGSMVTGLLSGGSGGFASPFTASGEIQSPAAFPVRAGQAASIPTGGTIPFAAFPITNGDRTSQSPAMNVTFNVQATDAESFARSQSQIAAMLSRTVALGNRNL